VIALLLDDGRRHRGPFVQVEPRLKGRDQLNSLGPEMAAALTVELLDQFRGRPLSRLYRKGPCCSPWKKRRGTPLLRLIPQAVARTAQRPGLILAKAEE